MIIEVDETHWKQIINANECSIFFNSQFLNAIANNFNYKLHYLVFHENGKYLLSGAFYSYNRNIITPLAFTYASIQIEDISDRKYIEVINSLCVYLKKEFRKISLRLPLDITDLRPFIWEGFRITNRYTYVKSVDDFFYKSIEKNKLKVKLKAENAGFSFKVEIATEDDIDRVLGSLKKLFIRRKTIKSHKDFLLNLGNTGVLIAFNAYLNAVLNCTSLVLIDKNLKKSYALLIQESDNKLVHTFLYVKRLEWLQQNDFEKIDFCGANSKGLANFKSFFNPVLKPYYLVNYNPFSYKLLNIWNAFKLTTKKILVRLWI